MSNPTFIIVGREPTPEALVEIADGMVGALTCVLHAAGSDVYTPDAQFLDHDPPHWPEGLFESTGRFLAHDGSDFDSDDPLSPPVLGIRLDYHLKGFFFRATLAIPGCPPVQIEGTGKPLIILRTMANAVHQAARELDLPIPHDFDWREIAGGQTAKSAWKMLEIFGAQSHAEPIAAAPVTMSH